jgi:hypothetical protein
MPSSPTFPGIDALIWIMWVAGGALLLAGWLGRVDRAVGWAGLWIGAVGFATSSNGPPSSHAPAPLWQRRRDSSTTNPDALFPPVYCRETETPWETIRC